MSTFVYSPGVRAVISTRAGIVDVSDDISAGSLTLNQDQPHTLSLTLTNQFRKYDGLFQPNDRISVQLKRVSWLQVFSGYLDHVPLFSYYPKSVSLTASCTLKKLVQRLYDQASAATVSVLGKNYTAGGGNTDDKQKIIDVLTEIGGWNPNEIHIGDIPKSWMSQIQEVWAKVGPEIMASSDQFISGSTIAGKNYNSPAAVKDITAHSFDGASEAQRGILVARLALAFFPASDILKMVAIAYRESNWEPGVINHEMVGLGPNGGSPYGNAMGLWQIVSNPNETGNGGQRDATRLLDPVYNATIAAAFIAARPSLSDWNGGKAPSDFYVRAQEAISAAQKQSSITNLNAVKTSITGLFSGKAVDPNAAALSTSSSSSAIGAPNVAAKAVQQAETQIGVWYVWGGNSPGGGFDCSGLIEWAYKQAGFTVPRDTYSQWNATKGNQIDWKSDHSKVMGGDMIFYYGKEHVTMAISSTQQIEAPHTGTKVNVNDIRWNNDIYGITRPTASGSNVVASGGTNGGDTSAGMGGDLINLQQWADKPQLTLLSGYRVLMDDQPLMPLISNLTSAAMRHCCSAPNGDFIAWFADYFGLYGTTAQMTIEPIEVVDFTIDWTDDLLKTHEFVIGSSYGWSDPGITYSAQDTSTQVLEQMTGGIASIDFPEILDLLFNKKGSPKNASSQMFTAEYIYNRYGARIKTDQVPALITPQSQFWYAVNTFMSNWSQQFSAVPQITFMPELWPGMTVQMKVPEGSSTPVVQCYVQQVTHTWSLTDGGGFTTRPLLIAPSSPGGGFIGLPDPGAVAPMAASMAAPPPDMSAGFRSFKLFGGD